MKRSNKSIVFTLLTSIVIIFTLSCETTKMLPILSTTEMTEITQTSAFGGGIITFDGGLDVTTRGVCWSVKPNPTIKNDKTIDAGGTGEFTSEIKGLIPDTTYYARAYATNHDGTSYGLQVTFKTKRSTLPVITTSIVTDIAETTATSGGNISFDGGTPITARGVCWSTSTNPTILNSKTVNGVDTGTFISNITNLRASTIYYVRSYATNKVGTNYGNQVSFKFQLTVNDIDGNIYSVVTIGTQRWMVENLKTTKYNDGASIPLIYDSYSWIYASTAGYCWLNNNSNTKNSNGAIYNFYAASNGKLAPIGWHVATQVDYNTLVTYLGGYQIAGSKLKETGNSNWFNLNSDATNSSGFTAIPSGYRTITNGDFMNSNIWGVFWSSTELNGKGGRLILENTSGITDFSYDNKNQGFSVRCVAD